MKTVAITIVWALLICLVGAPVAADPGSAATVVPANTTVALILGQDLRSGQQKAGDAVTYITICDITAPDGKVLVPAGALAHGVVTKSQGCGGFGKNGKLEITCDYIDAPGGARVDFADPDLKKHGKSSQLATMLFTPFILTPFTKGKDVELHKGLVLTMQVKSDTAISAPLSDEHSQTVLLVLERGRRKKPFQASVKSVTADAITFATDTGDKALKVKDIDAITLEDAPVATASAATGAE